MDAALVTRALAAAEAPPPPAQAANKWDILRDLAEARQRWCLTDRDLTVLQALLSFHPHATLDATSLVVFPSNASICARLNGMPLSTMRRHLANLVASGVIERRDSPNGKRYARRGSDAFGFDLAPLARFAARFKGEAEALRAERDALRRLRETVSLMRRDLAALADFGRATAGNPPLWESLLALATEAAKLLRRKLDSAQLSALEGRLAAALSQARAALAAEVSEESSTNDADFERHHQDSNKEHMNTEKAAEIDPAATLAEAVEPDKAQSGHPGPNLPLHLVVAACREAISYAAEPIRHWPDLLRVAETVRPMMGITDIGWREAQATLGPREASIVLLAMLERFSDLRSPGGYLRSLTRKGAEGTFSSTPMVLALLRRAA